MEINIIKELKKLVFNLLIILDMTVILFVFGESSRIPQAILPIMFENPIAAIATLMCSDAKSTNPIIFGRYMYGRYCVKSPNRLAMHKQRMFGCTSSEKFNLFFRNSINGVMYVLA